MYCRIRTVYAESIVSYCVASQRIAVRHVHHFLFGFFFVFCLRSYEHCAYIGTARTPYVSHYICIMGIMQPALSSRYNFFFFNISFDWCLFLQHLSHRISVSLSLFLRLPAPAQHYEFLSQPIIIFGILANYFVCYRIWKFLRRLCAPLVCFYPFLLLLFFFFFMFSFDVHRKQANVLTQ